MPDYYCITTVEISISLDETISILTPQGDFLDSITSRAKRVMRFFYSTVPGEKKSRKLCYGSAGNEEGNHTSYVHLKKSEKKSGFFLDIFFGLFFGYFLDIFFHFYAQKNRDFFGYFCPEKNFQKKI